MQLTTPMKRIIRYMQDQAVQASEQKHSGPAYLSPPEKDNHRHSCDEEGTSSHLLDSTHPNAASHGFLTHAPVRASHEGNGDVTEKRSPFPLPDKICREISRHQYAQDNILQSYELYIPEQDSSRVSRHHGQKYWVLFIHGGYFCDESVTAASFRPALSQLIKSPKLHLQHLTKHNGDKENVAPYIAGYASINYRLSPSSTSPPQDPDKSPKYELRDASWPDHIYDVLTAISHLQSKYRFGEKYLLVGHSVGATMALLSTLASKKFFTESGNSATFRDIQPPMAVLGLCGIYDFELLHRSFPHYKSLTSNAIPDPTDAVLASPARYSRQDYRVAWERRESPPRVLILAHSHDDGLVDWAQLLAMKDVFMGDEEIKDAVGSRNGGIAMQVVEMRGRHDDIWRQGTELARVIRLGIATLRRLEHE